VCQPAGPLPRPGSELLVSRVFTVSVSRAPRYGISQYYAEPIVQGCVDLELDLDNAEAILRVIGNLHSDPNIFSVVANICLKSETKENFVMKRGNV